MDEDTPTVAKCLDQISEMAEEMQIMSERISAQEALIQSLWDSLQFEKNRSQVNYDKYTSSTTTDH